MPPGHPCRFRFPFSFSFLLFFLRFSSPFMSSSVFPVLFPFSSCRFSVCCIAFVAFLFTFPAFLGGGFCYSVISSRRYVHPPRAPCEPEVCVVPLCAVFFLAFLLSILFIYCLLFFPFFRFRFGHRLFHPVLFLRVLCCLLGFGFCCDSFRT